jgi:hypothetical protein
MGLIREIKLEISYVVFALGVFLTVLVIFNYFLRASLPGVIIDLLDDIGNWIVWFVVLGPLLTMIGGWYFIDVIRKQREFERLISVPSKALFVRNQERLERLAWYLSSEYERRLIDRKRHWKIKD